jgi:transposase
MQEVNNTLDDLDFSKENFHILKQELIKATAKIQWFEEQFKISRDRVFGKSSEKLPKQQLLFDAMESDEVEVEPEKETITYTRNKPKSCGRKLNTSQLPRERVEHDIEDKHCSCCGKELVRIGEDVSEQVEFVPAVLKVIEHVTLKYACKDCSTIKQGKKPESVIPKAMAATSLITEVVIKKYQHHQPLYRQSKIFSQEGFDIPDNTLGNWVMKAGVTLELLEDALWGQVPATKVLQADETPVVVLSRDTKGYMWVYNGCDPGNRFIIFEYANTRTGAVVNNRLDKYEGILQTDGYSGYNKLRDKEKIINVGCWAHSRRKYMAIVKTAKTTGKAHQGVSYIDKLYKLEREIKDLKFADRKRLRQEKAKPILDKLKKWVNKSLLYVPSQSAIGKALSYTTKQWPYLYEYINHGEVEIDNNWAENQIRPFALGRKNWLFLGNEDSAAISARYYSLIQSCIINKIDPRNYLSYVFTQVHKMRRGEVDPKTLLPQFIDRNLLS